MKHILRATVAAGSLAAASASFAQDAAPKPGTPDYHAEDQQIVVSAALPRKREDVISGVAVLTSEELTAAIRPAIGDTLQHTPGVSATSFGPSASRPVLRGLQGERVRLLTNGIGSIDVSNTSVDHAAVVNPLLAERIEVLRGPQSLLYGSAAIGGVVNVIDSRIPNSIPSAPVHFDALASYGSAARERSASVSAAARLGGGFVAHGDASWLKSDDLRIGGYALTPALRAQALASANLTQTQPDPIDFAANAAIAGILPNTASRTWSAGAGLAFIDDHGSVGAAYSHYDSLYGVPVRFATQPGQEQEAPRLSLVQDRLDGRAEVATDGRILSRIALRVGYADYRHAEIDESGAVGTTFFNKGLEARLELSQATRGAWSGANGVQYVNRLFDVSGDEAFLPRNATESTGLFTLQQLDLGSAKVEAGARWEHSSMSSKPLPSQPQFFSGERSFDALSASLGGSVRFAGAWRAGVNLSRTERAPAAEELFANGPHAGTEAFEIGDPTLGKERATSAEFILRKNGGAFDIELSAYRTRFAGYVFEDRTGAVIDGLPEYRIRQGRATYYGFEAQANATVGRSGDWEFGADGLADYVHATIDGYGPAPRIPPLRILGGLTAKSTHFDLRAEAEHVTTQNRTAPNETATEGFTLVNAEAAWRPWGKDRPLSLIVSANNIFDVVARRHASFLKDYAPLAGRDIRVTARLEI